MLSKPRLEIQQKIKEGDLLWLLKKAGELHGHFCPFVALGVKASVIALNRLGVFTDGIDENIIAIVEVNNCFVDGVQMITGCSLGNNSLVYKDYGKNAVTLAKRDGQAIRVSILPGYPQKIPQRVPGAQGMFERFIQRREKGTSKQMEHFKEVWESLSFEQLDVSIEEQFSIEHLSMSLPDKAPILQSVICSVCAESIMESRVRILNGKPVCIPCSKNSYFILEGRGMHMHMGAA